MEIKTVFAHLIYWYSFPLKMLNLSGPGCRLKKLGGNFFTSELSLVQKHPPGSTWLKTQKVFKIQIPYLFERRHPLFLE